MTILLWVFDDLCPAHCDASGDKAVYLNVLVEFVAACSAGLRGQLFDCAPTATG